MEPLPPARPKTRRYWMAVLAGSAVLGALIWKFLPPGRSSPPADPAPERIVDTFNGVAVYYNGEVANTYGRHLAPDGYNLGLKYQCVEFVKRYYYQHLHHKMPDSYGHAREFFDPALADGTYNPKRDLVQYTNGGAARPCPDDLLVFGPSATNSYGHVAIVSAVTDTEVEIVQQNPGPKGSSRVRIPITHEAGTWRYQNDRILGWLRRQPKN